MASLYPNNKRMQSATRYYNCHSFAWHDAHMTNKIWLNYPEAYMNDGSYLLSQDVKNDYRIYYDNGDPLSDHSGIVARYDDTGTYVLSKWGDYGLWLHQVLECPYYTHRCTRILFYRQNLL